MAGLKELDQEVIKLLNKLAVARWTDIRRNLPKEILKGYPDKTIDTYLTRSLKRLQSLGYIYKTEASPKGGRYYLNPLGMLIAYKISQSISVDEPLRDPVLSFGHTLQWIKNRAIITAERDTIEDYYRCFKEAIIELDIERFVSEVALFEDMLRGEEDPPNDSGFVKYSGNREKEE